jgi:uncharacterized protein (DUF1800 family)
MVITNCATLGLETYVPSPDCPWDVARVQHLFRRAGFGATPDEIERALTDGPAATVNRIFDEAVARPARPAPEWAGLDYDAMMAAEIDPFGAFISLHYDWFEDAITYGVREKMSLFWQNHLVTIYEIHSCPSYHYRYLKLIEEEAFGNFHDLIQKMTTEPAMLFFLNGFENTRQHPNENYARELFELFTLGVNNNYTEEDIVEASRALTGYNGWTSYCGPVEWAEWGFDPTPKTVFGETREAMNTEILIDVLFEQRPLEISTFICEKLYRYYVNKARDETVIDGLATTLRDNGWNLLPVIKQLFASAHFYDAANEGVLVKSPLEMNASFLRQGNFGDFENRLDWGIWAAANAGQYVGHPLDVAGWTGDRAWIDANRLTLRWDFMDGYAWAVHNASEATYPDLAKRLTGNSNSPEIIARAIVDYYIPRGLVSEEAYATATDVLKWEIPENYFTTGQWTLDYPAASWQLTLLLRFIGRLPEFQLN